MWWLEADGRCLPQPFLTLLLETGLSLSMEFADLLKINSQQALGFLLTSSLVLCTGIRDGVDLCQAEITGTTHFPDFYLGPGELNRSWALLAGFLLTEPAPQPQALALLASYISFF